MDKLLQEICSTDFLTSPICSARLVESCGLQLLGHLHITAFIKAESLNQNKLAQVCYPVFVLQCPKTGTIFLK